MNLLLIKGNDTTKISGSSLEYLNHEKNKIELETNELFDVCFFSIDEHNLSELPVKLPPKTIKVFDKKTIKVRNDDEQWNDVKGVEASGGSKNKKGTTIVKQYNKQENEEIINDDFSLVPITIFTPDMWYCGSVEFNAVAQYYKGNHDTFSEHQWHSWYIDQGIGLISNKQKRYLPFINYIKRLGFNYE